MNLVETPFGILRFKKGLLILDTKSIEWINHFFKYSNCYRESPVLLLLDSLESHISVTTLDLAIQHGIAMVVFYQLQPLDRTVFGPRMKRF